MIERRRNFSPLGDEIGGHEPINQRRIGQRHQQSPILAPLAGVEPLPGDGHVVMRMRQSLKNKTKRKNAGSAELPGKIRAEDEF